MESNRREEQAQTRELQTIMVNTMREQQAGRERALELTRTKRLRMGVDIPILPKLGNPKEIETFLELFRRDMTTFDVPRGQWATILRPLLDDRSADYSRHLPQKTQDDFDLLAVELTTLHGISPESHGTTWRELTRGEGEDLLQWYVRIQFAAKAWMKDCTSMADIIERLGMERFLCNLDGPTELWTRTPLARRWLRLLTDINDTPGAPSTT